MFHFSNKQSKYKHIKKNNCKPKSIIHAINNNITNNNITDNINNYGSERIDYISNEDISRMIKDDSNTLPLYIECKHFNKNFPENNNIKYDKNKNIYLIKENNKWNKIKISLLISKIIKDNSEYLLNYCKNSSEFKYIPNKNSSILVATIKYLIDNYNI